MTDELAALAAQVNPDPPAREMDMLLTAGERISMALLAIALDVEGVQAMSLTGSQAGILTVGGHGAAEIHEIRSFRVQEGLDEGKVVIVAGFQGVDPTSKEVTTLGRGGSDVSAVSLAAAHSAEVCEIYKDVDGVFTADPKVVAEARLLDRLSYDEMLAMATGGSQVLMARALETGIRYGVPIHVRSAFHEGPGTWIGSEGQEGRLICGVAHEPGAALFSIEDGDQTLRDDVVADIRASGSWVDIEGEHSADGIVLALPESGVERARGTLSRRHPRPKLSLETGLGRVSVVGSAIPARYDLIESGRATLDQQGIPVRLWVLASNRLTFYVDGPALSDSVRALHRHFEPPLIGGL